MVEAGGIDPPSDMDRSRKFIHRLALRFYCRSNANRKGVFVRPKSLTFSVVTGRYDGAPAVKVTSTGQPQQGDRLSTQMALSRLSKNSVGVGSWLSTRLTSVVDRLGLHFRTLLIPSKP